ncbi:formimidoylglutamate deiminase [Vibrio sp. MA40-2]|uniref:formimidoylglutamate deiminase n=1 Tax=Vibrio sp. MA40-2 TaxID=3391828 RepID=UPI0039A40DEF
MMQYFFNKALVGNAWAEDVLVYVDSSGVITSINEGAPCPTDAKKLNGLVIPSMPNLHSHAFQRAMAGLAEVAGDPDDSFWTWRQQMYALVGQLTPEQVGIIARYLYVDMLKGGYTQVAEFNYLHHDKNGDPYKQDDMAIQLQQAAKSVGIGQTLLPVLYTYSGFGQQRPDEIQKRFIQTTQQYLERFHHLQTQCSSLNSLGICFHSLRAVSKAQIQHILAELPADLPIHIHIAEQIKEVNDCLDWSGLRPVEYLFEHFTVDKRWCLIHATHLTDKEVASIAQSGAIAGICPTTEANLGDGLFPAGEFLSQHGNWGIGSDSHVSVSALEELRWFEYGQRLRQQKRNRLASEVQPSVGQSLWTQAAKGGAQACGVAIGEIKVGCRADWLELKETEWLSGLSYSQQLNRWLFSGEKSQINHVYVAGKQVIKNGDHELDQELNAQFAEVMDTLFT